LLAFDGCNPNDSWNEVHEFLGEMNRIDKNRLRFTFFVSGTALLTEDKANLYVNPSVKLHESDDVARNPEWSAFVEKARRLQKGRSFSTEGESNVNFGGSLNDLKERIRLINLAHQNGNEIASHAVGHFNAKKWTRDMWEHEFDEFNEILDNVGKLNGDRSIQLNFNSQDLMGFRAPYLSGNESLIRTLDKRKFRYDTSDTNIGWEQDNWPQKYKITGTNIWNFGLAFIEVVGLKSSNGNPVRTMSMDYNFCFLQDKGCPELYPKSIEGADRDAYIMLLSYLKYFSDNYNSNRAPVHIGHHFTKYRGGAYNKALYHFAKIVCELPEVNCITYSKLSDYMDGLSDATRRDFQYSRFPKASFQPSLKDLQKKIRW